MVGYQEDEAEIADPMLAATAADELERRAEDDIVDTDDEVCMRSIRSELLLAEQGKRAACAATLQHRKKLCTHRVQLIACSKAGGLHWHARNGGGLLASSPLSMTVCHGGMA